MSAPVCVRVLPWQEVQVAGGADSVRLSILSGSKNETVYLSPADADALIRALSAARVAACKPGDFPPMGKQQ